MKPTFRDVAGDAFALLSSIDSECDAVTLKQVTTEDLGQFVRDIQPNIREVLSEYRETQAEKPDIEIIADPTIPKDVTEMRSGPNVIRVRIRGDEP